MKIEPAVKKETAIVVIGVTALSAVMVLCFAVAGHFDMSVLWGALLGTALSCLNFFLMGLGVQAAATKMHGVQLSQSQDDQQEEDAAPSPQSLQAKRLVQLSYHGRMLLCVAVMLVAMLVPVFDMISAAIPLLFPRLIIMGQGAVQKIREGK